ncbi:MAG: hypothetical protein ABI383_05840 [Acidobacteriaceae bacterium]
MKLPRHAEIWLPAYLSHRAAGLLTKREVRNVFVAITDHYEPLWNNANLETGRQRVALWREHWPRLAEKVGRDSSGNLPKYSFFYPQDEYFPELVEPLAEMARMGIADVEVHIHHDGEGRDAFIKVMSEYVEALHGNHGLLRRERAGGKLLFGFIHGNWTLDNSGPAGRMCGLNDELAILRDLGCYADFTMPSGRSTTQARMINEIYWATDDVDKPKSYDTGVPVTPGGPFTGDLLMITGPFGLRWHKRVYPRIETGELASNDPMDAARARRLFELAPMIGNDLFIKLYSHGTQEHNSDLLLKKENLIDTYRLLQLEAQRRGAAFHFVSAWEMFQAVKAAAQITHTSELCLKASH